MTTLFLIWAMLATIWAGIATLMIVRNPFPFPDRGHRVFGVKDEATRAVVVKLIETLSGKKSLYTFDSGDIHQTILADGFTSIHYITRKPANISACAVSLAVKNPSVSAHEAIRLLQSEGFTANIVENIETNLPPNHLVPVASNAFDGWVLVFRRPLLKMPRPQFRK